MRNSISTIIHSVTRDKINNIIYLPYDGLFEQSFSELPFKFYTNVEKSRFGWSEYIPLPPNFINVTNFKNLPHDIEYDLIICNDKDKQYNFAKQISNIYHLPLLIIEHEHSPKFISKRYKEYLEEFVTEKTNRIVTDESINKDWNTDYQVIPYSNIPQLNIKKNTDKLLIVGDYGKKDYPAIQQLLQVPNAEIIGNNPGLSKTSMSLEEILMEIASCRIFINLAVGTKAPIWLLYAMTSGKPIVSNISPWIDSLLENEESAMLSTSISGMKSAIKRILRNKQLEIKLQDNVREDSKVFSVNRDNSWKQIVEDVGSSIYIRK